MSVGIPVPVVTFSVALYLIGFVMLSVASMYHERSVRDPEYVKRIAFAAAWPLMGLLVIYVQTIR